MHTYVTFLSICSKKAINPVQSNAYANAKPKRTTAETSASDMFEYNQTIQQICRLQAKNKTNREKRSSSRRASLIVNDIRCSGGFNDRWLTNSPSESVSAKVSGISDEWKRDNSCRQSSGKR
uniref:Uncharacterized protein n=1 Tax=Ceratitis capitata TaxID=7213 RepID=W8CE00_CERCA